MKTKKMVVTDLDGTLLGTDRKAGDRNLDTLLTLGREQVRRVVATGRSLFSARKVLVADFPIDYLIFSSGAGIMDWGRQTPLLQHSLSREEVALVFHCLNRRRLDFMLHFPIPENHRFRYFCSGMENSDFMARIEIYREYALPARWERFETQEACQFVIVEAPNGKGSAYEALKAELIQFQVIRTTSPIDGKTCWIEIFPKKVSKALAAAWVASRHDIDRENVLAIGNDYNDVDLLEWAGTSSLVGNAAGELHGLFPLVATNDNSGFSEAVSFWLKKT